MALAKRLLANLRMHARHFAMRMLRSFGQLFVQCETRHQTAWLQVFQTAWHSSVRVPEHLNCSEPRMALLRSSCLAWGVLLELCLCLAAQCDVYSVQSQCRVRAEEPAAA